ncbi:MAG: associated Golgi protein-like protein [Oscillospiraceae bacterium]|jgi:uncharacterized membrane protein YdjX (TVP38/TMEM64 family)|nr:associated Golgi protein-like protein [Oscillospiraceae bacterium]
MIKEFKNEIKNDKKSFIKFIVLAVLVIIVIVTSIKMFPWIISLKDESARNELRNFILSYGFWGWVITLGIQILQVLVAFIPGEPIEIIAGLIYGTWGGLLLCLLGSLIGSIVIFFMVKLLGSSFVNAIIPEEKFSKFKFLHDSQRLELVVFILFIIPGTPKDVLTYFVPLTKMKPLRFFIISTFARIPAVISSTFLGSSIENNEWSLAIFMFVLTAIIGLLGIMVHNKFINKQNP